MVDTILPLAELSSLSSARQNKTFLMEPSPPSSDNSLFPNPYSLLPNQTSYPMSANPQHSPRSPSPPPTDNSLIPNPYSLSPNQTLWVKLPSEQHPLFGHIQLLLTMFPGPGRMILYCEKEKKRIGTHCVLHEALLAELRELCGEKNVVLK